MKKLDKSTVITIVLAILIIATAYLTIRYYSYVNMQGTLDKIKELEVNWGEN